MKSASGASIVVVPVKVEMPLTVSPVRPEATPAPVTSQTLESMVTLSPLSPRVTTPLASSVPLAVSVPESVAAAATMVPVSVGLADITTLPVPVMALDTRFLDASVKTACDAVRPEKLMVPGVYKVPDTVSAVVDAYGKVLAVVAVEVKVPEDETLPLESTWKRSPSPTVRSAAGGGAPIPTLPQLK